MPTKCCLICDSAIQAARMIRYPRAVLCGSEVCALVQHRQKIQQAAQKARYVSEYLPPDDGAIDSADPHFRAKVRPCGRCGQTFKQSVRWRYFCERCRYSTAVKNPPTDRTYGISSGRRSGGG